MFRWTLLLVAAVLMQPIVNASPGRVGLDELMNGCGETKACFGSEKDCIARKDCTAAVSVVSKEGLYEFEVQTVEGVYVAVGITETSSMFDAAVVQCAYSNATTEAIKVFVSCNPAADNRTTILSTLTLEEDGITVLDTSFADNSVYCKYTRKPYTQIGGLTFDLINMEYFMLLAMGTQTQADGSMAFHDIHDAHSDFKQYLHMPGLFADTSAANALQISAALLPIQLLYIIYKSM